MVTQAIGTQLQDPLNRLYRERLAQSVAKFLQSTTLTPNVVTVLHTLIGVLGAFLIFQERYVLAVLCLELRAVLDCADGILARLKNQSTATGRALDAIGDGIAFNALMIAGTMRLITDFKTYPHPTIVVGVLIYAFIAVHSGVVYHLMRRKLVSIANKEVDRVELEWREHYEQSKAKKATLLDRFGFWIDSMTIKFVSEEWYVKVLRRKDLKNWQEIAVHEAEIMHELACKTRKKEFKKAVRATSFVSDDNVFSLMSFCFIVFGLFHQSIFPFVHPVLIAFSVGLVYSVITLFLGLRYYQSFLHGVYRE
jgi:phosphatidylglycerophosphate synthase